MAKIKGPVLMRRPFFIYSGSSTRHSILPDYIPVGKLQLIFQLLRA